MHTRAVDWHVVRAEFPAAADLLHLDVLSGLPMSRRAADAGQRAFEAHLSWPRRAPQVAARDIARVCARMAGLLGASPEEVVPIAGAAYALERAARSLGESAHIVAMADDRPEVTRPFVRHGHRVTCVASAPDATVAPAAVGGAVRADTRMVVTSAVLPETGFRHDLAAIAACCRARGVRLFVDASSSVGLVAADVRACRPDALVCGLDGGASVLYRDRARAGVWPAVDAIEADTAAMPGLLALGGALDLVDEIGIERIEARVHALTGRLHARLEARGFDVVSPRPVSQRAGITIVGLADPPGVAAALADAGIVTAPCARGLRVAIHVCTTEADLDRVVEALVCVRRGEAVRPVRDPAGPRVCVDLNGVLDSYSGWKGPEHWDPPRAGAGGFLAALRADGCRVTVFTTRHYRGVWQWLAEHGLAALVDEVTDRKPPADVFIDDRAVGFRGDFETALHEVRAFRPHWQQERAAPRR